jgi:AcrR family transcriptional regulator
MTEPMTFSAVSRRFRGPAAASSAEVAIFAALERLLDTFPLHDISMSQIAAEADTSRATLYRYFPSKFAIVAALLLQLTEEFLGTLQSVIERPANDSPEQAIRDGLKTAIELWKRHAPVLRATVEHWHAVPELRSVWLELMNRSIAALATYIEHERAVGLAPPGEHASRLASALAWSTERCFYISGVGVDDHLHSLDDIFVPLITLWLGAIYGSGTTERTIIHDAE